MLYYIGAVSLHPLKEHVMAGLIDSAVGRNPDVRRIIFSSEPLKALPEKIKKELEARAEEDSKTGFPYLPLSLYKDFARTGNRERFQTPYFQKRRMLSELTIREAAIGDGKYIDAIEDGIWAILSEPVWTIPAHNSYIRDAVQPEVPLTERPILDLFQCETGEVLAVAISILKDKLNPILIKDAEHAIRTRILEPYMTDHFWWMGNDGDMNNWSPWCTQNVLLSLLTLDLSEKEKRKVLKTAISTLDLYISSYPDDGGCDEGASYYHAAALALWGALHVISLATGNDLADVFGNDKIKAMAEYVEKVHVADDIYLNFADCSQKAGRLGAREYLFAKAVGSDAMMHHAASDYAKYSWREEDNNYNLFYMYLALTNHDEIMDESKKEHIIEKPSFTSFPGLGLGIYREKGITFAIKGGNNGESHNHNDVGSFILYKGSTPCLIDIGVETYTKTTFSKDRYTLLPMRSSYHNLVNFPPLEEHDGKEFCGKTLILDENKASFDITAAFEKNRGLDKYIRTAFFDRKNMKIEITEDFIAENPAVLSLISVEKPIQESNTLKWSGFHADFSKDITARTEEMEIKDARLRRAWPEKLYRTLITLPEALTWVIDLS